MKLINKITALTSLITLILLTIFYIYVSGVYFNGYYILIFIYMFINPIRNLYISNKKIINNIIYHMYQNIVNAYTSFILVNSIKIYLKYRYDYESEHINDAVNYFGEKFLIIIGLVIISLIISLVFKKKKLESKKDNSNIIITINLIISIIILFNYTDGFIIKAFDIANIVFLLMVLLKKINMNITSEMQRYYGIIMLSSIFSFNPISLITITGIYIGLDKFGTNI